MTFTPPDEKEGLVNVIPETDFNVFKATVICGDPFFGHSFSVLSVSC